MGIKMSDVAKISDYIGKAMLVQLVYMVWLSWKEHYQYNLMKFCFSVTKKTMTLVGDVRMKFWECIMG